MNIPSRPPRFLLTVAALGLAACAGAATDPALEDPPLDRLVWLQYSVEEARATFGRYRLDSTPVIAPPTATADGEFRVASSSPAGHRVGWIGGRLAIWPAGAGAPSYLFPPDTNETGFMTPRISDRLEVALASGSSSSTTVYAWRANELRKVYGPDCLSLRALNSRGMIGLNTTCRLYNSGFVVFSPFDPDSSRSGRFAGQVCNVGGRYSGITALDDENDVLRFVERMPGGGPVDVVSGTGCVVLGDKFGDRAFSWTTLRSGLIGGRLWTVTGFNVGVITDGDRIAAVNDLLSATTAAKWRILAVTRIDGGRTLVCEAISLADGRTETVRLVPDG